MASLPAATGGAAPRVATTINPFGDVAHQARCFAAWRALGFAPLTFNTEKEASSLVATGLFAASDVLVLAEEDTGKALHGKAIPRVLPALERLVEDAPERPVILANADIYPALRDDTIMRLWLAEAPALALTREDCALIEAHSILDSQPYRNGLDVFVFRPGVLAEVVGALARYPVSQRMCFGIPGWDFLLGAIVRSPAIGGQIMDSAVLLHEIHRQTYDDVAEFAHYVPAMAALGETGAAGDSAADAAYAFHQRIVAECAAGDTRAALVRAMFYAPPRPPAVPGTAARRIALDLAERIAFIGWNYDFDALTALAQRQIATAAPFERTRRFFRTGAGPEHAFAEELAATLFQLSCRAPVAATVRARDAAPPEGLATILDNTAEDSPLRTERLAILFGELLVERGEFSLLLHDYLALACPNAASRTLLRDIAVRTAMRSADAD